MEPDYNFQSKKIGQTEQKSLLSEDIKPVNQPFIPQKLSKKEQIKQFYHDNKWYVWASVLGVVIIGVLAYLVFRPGSGLPSGEANVAVSIDAPETAPTGSEVVYKIKIENNDKANLVDMQLELVYPDGFSYISSSPKADNENGSRFPVPSLSNGQNAVIMVKAKAVGDINDEKKLVAVLHYKYNNFNSEFLKQATHTLRLVASDIKLEISGPEKALPTDNVSYEISYENLSEETINDGRLELSYPDGFVFTEASPSPSIGKNIWPIPSLKPGDKGTVTVKGNYSKAQQGQDQELKAEFKALDDNGDYFTQASSSYITSVSSQTLQVSQQVSLQQSGIANPGQQLDFSIKYSNNGKVVASGVNIIVTLDSKALDFYTIKAEGADIEGSTITWNAASDQKLEELSPSDSGTLHYSVKVKNPATKDSSKNLTVISKIQIKSNEYKDPLPGNEISIKISSPSKIITDASFVSGQLPPKPGKQTTFKVELSLNNSSNDLTSGVLTAFIPTGYTFDKASIISKEASNVNYDSATGKITWKVGTVVAHSGSFAPLRTLSFNVTVTPSSNQINQELTLLRSINFSAKDSFTGAEIKLSSQDIKSSDIPDGNNKGRVEP